MDFTDPHWNMKALLTYFDPYSNIEPLYNENSLVENIPENGIYQAAGFLSQNSNGNEFPARCSKDTGLYCPNETYPQRTQFNQDSNATNQQCSHLDTADLIFQ